MKLPDFIDVEIYGKLIPVKMTHVITHNACGEVVVEMKIADKDMQEAIATASNDDYHDKFPPVGG